MCEQGYCTVCCSAFGLDNFKRMLLQRSFTLSGGHTIWSHAGLCILQPGSYPAQHMLQDRVHFNITRTHTHKRHCLSLYVFNIISEKETTPNNTTQGHRCLVMSGSGHTWLRHPPPTPIPRLLTPAEEVECVVGSAVLNGYTGSPAGVQRDLLRHHQL